SAGGINPVILSHHAWRQYFNGTPSVIGQSLQLDHAPYSVVGVMPSGFQFPIDPEPVDAWITIAVDAVASDGKPMLAQRGGHYLDVIARLKPDVSPAQAQAQMRAIVDGLNRQYSDEGLRGARVTPESAHLTSNFRTALLILLGAVGCVLLIACANLAS